MSHLLAIAVGPVQEFIAAARRTRDLWFGSYLLSEISRAVAKSVEPAGGKLIFPASSDAENVANVILAELPAGEPKNVAAKAKHAAQTRWLEFINDAWNQAHGVIRKEIWDEQKNDVIEFYAAWVQQTGDYKADRKKLMRLLAGRKNCRDFPAANGADVGIPKSSLDGQRPSVFVQPEQRSKRDELRADWPTALRLSPGEELDVVGVTKRVGKRKGEQHPSYPSVARVAAETWLSAQERQGNLDVLKQACNKLVSKGLNTVREENYQYFRYEGTVIFKHRLTDLQKELKLQDSDIAELKAALAGLRGEPNPYLAVLVADGDKMGASISALSSPDEHREFSRTLAGFANSARTIVNDHNGVLVYAGGDDVLAFLPVDKCLGCARKLHDDFGKLLAQYGNPTLSVGIAIGHFMENLEDLLDYGRAAEKAAKKVEGTDALAVHLHKRGGVPVKMASQWGTQPDQRLTLYAELIQADALPSKLPYDLQKLAELYRDWPSATVLEAMQRDALRIIADKQPRAGRRYMRQVQHIVQGLADAKALQSFCNELLIARLLAEVFTQARREPTELQRLVEEVAHV